MSKLVSEACQINDLDHRSASTTPGRRVSEACQINDLDHQFGNGAWVETVSEACQINDLDHGVFYVPGAVCCFRSLSDQ